MNKINQRGTKKMLVTREWKKCVSIIEELVPLYTSAGRKASELTANLDAARNSGGRVDRSLDGHLMEQVTKNATNFTKNARAVACFGAWSAAQHAVSGLLAPTLEAAGKAVGFFAVYDTMSRGGSKVDAMDNAARAEQDLLERYKRE